jgi:hypothetical protein
MPRTCPGTRASRTSLTTVAEHPIVKEIRAQKNLDRTALDVLGELYAIRDTYEASEQTDDDAALAAAQAVVAIARMSAAVWDESAAWHALEGGYSVLPLVAVQAQNPHRK